MGSALTITNQFGWELGLSVQDVTTTGSLKYDLLDNSRDRVPIETGDEINVSVTCDGTSDGTISTVIFAESDDGEISVRTMQDVIITCNAGSS